MRLWSLILASALALPSGSFAQSDLSKVIDALKMERASGQPGVATFTIGGAGRAYLIANVRLQSRGSQRLYCPPGNLTLLANNYADIALSEYDQNYASYGDLWEKLSGFDALVLILADGLQRTFPCK